MSYHFCCNRGIRPARTEQFLVNISIIIWRGEISSSLFSRQVVIKYVPYVGDSKRAMDEYTSEIMMGGRSTIAIHNTCEDSLLAAPIILDLVILAEVCQVKRDVLAS